MTRLGKPLVVRAVAFGAIYGAAMLAYRVVIENEPFVRTLVITLIGAPLSALVFAYVSWWVERRHRNGASL